jgi:hypothetical protein
MNNLDDTAMEQLFSFDEIFLNDFVDIGWQPCDIFKDPWIPEQLDFGIAGDELLFNHDEWPDFQDLWYWSIDPDFAVADTAASYTIDTNIQIADARSHTVDVVSDVPSTQTMLPPQEQKPSHTFESCILEFPGGNQEIKWRRRQFSLQRRREVKEIRKAGACLRCRI